MKYVLFLPFVVLLGCNSQPASNATMNEKPNEFYHYSLWTALVNKIYDGNLTVKAGWVVKVK